jgi:alpha-galactosidase
MLISWDESTNQLHLCNGRISYIARVLEDGSFGHLHFGPALTPGRSYRHLGPDRFEGFSNRVGEPIAREYPTGGSGDFRVPAVVLEPADSSPVLHLAYAGHRILPGKPALPGLPATYVEADEEAETVEVLLRDEPSGIEVTLLYTIFADAPVVARSARIRNGGAQPVRVRCAMSASLDLPDASWDFVQLSGTWARERHVVTRPLVPGRQSVASLRGASGHEHNPFIVLARPATTEEAGEAYGFSLVYSGNFLAEVEVDPFDSTRVRLGINPESFCWTLDPGAELALPEAVLAYSGAGLGALSDAYHLLYRQRLARGAWRDRERPVLINNWEATYFDFNEDRLLAIAGAAQEMGIELFVLDDGWFGKRDDDTARSATGSWIAGSFPTASMGLPERSRPWGCASGSGSSRRW